MIWIDIDGHNFRKIADELREPDESKDNGLDIDGRTAAETGQQPEDGGTGQRFVCQLHVQRRQDQGLFPDDRRRLCALPEIELRTDITRKE